MAVPWQKRAVALCDCACRRVVVDFWHLGSAMNRRRWISYVVMLGVLLHAYALVRHNTVMLTAHLSHGALLSDLGILCQPSAMIGEQMASTPDAASSDLPHIPRPVDAQHDCPICSGLATVALLPTPSAEPYYLAFDPPALRPTAQAAPIVQLRTLSPPVRGPPSLV